jgi:hypothetical protein
MKKLTTILFLSTFALTASAQVKQGLFRPVNQDMFLTRTISVNKNNSFELKDTPVVNPTSFVFRFDATIVVEEVTINKVTKDLIVTPFSAVGPAIGIQHYVQKSSTDGTPVNNYGASIGLAIGKTVYEPNLAEAKVILALNIWQYFKFGGTYTFNPPTDIGHIGFFFGGGITF